MDGIKPAWSVNCSTQDFGGGAPQRVIFDSVEYQTGFCALDAGQGMQIGFPGLYLMTCFVDFTTSTIPRLFFYLNGSILEASYDGVNGTHDTLSVSCLARFATGDIVTPYLSGRVLATNGVGVTFKGIWQADI